MATISKPAFDEFPLISTVPSSYSLQQMHEKARKKYKLHWPDIPCIIWNRRIFWHIQEALSPQNKIIYKLIKTITYSAPGYKAHKKETCVVIFTDKNKAYLQAADFNLVEELYS